MRLTVKFFLLSVLLAFTHLASAQRNGNLPYSKFGIGEQYSNGSVRNMAMGGIGIGYADPRALNIQNPATAAYNRLTMFDVAARYDYRQLESESTNEENQAGNLAYLRISLPISPKWSTVFNVSPYSQVSYNYGTTGGTVSGDPSSSLIYGETGDGGLSKVALTNAVHLGKNLSAGLEMAYIFGAITKETSRQLIIGQPVNDRMVTVSESNYDDFSLRGGLTYRRPFSEGSERYFTIGAVYEKHFDIGGKRRTLLEKRRPNLPNIIRMQDTLSNNENASFQLPSTFEVGFSIDRPGKWSLGLDAGFTQWSAFRDLSEGNTLEDTYYVAVGGEFIPDAGAVSGFHKRVTYKAGLRFQRMPYSIRGQQFNDVGINFGFGLPVNKNAADVNLAFQLGERGTLDNDLIKEKYLNIIVGFTINDKWFRKRLIY